MQREIGSSDSFTRLTVGESKETSVGLTSELFLSWNDMSAYVI